MKISKQKAKSSYRKIKHNYGRDFDSREERAKHYNRIRYFKGIGILSTDEMSRMFAPEPEIVIDKVAARAVIAELQSQIDSGLADESFKEIINKLKKQIV